MKSNGNELTISSEGVPAFIYDNSTVVPISVLRNLGATVTWDANTYSVDISTTDSIVKQLFDEKIVTSGENVFYIQ
ncbi:stalk domain-containing protein [Paenibacillus sp. N3.4]|uniref:stalk domain-containing protein n=1 Tax=Paenibacillus sp. N3.4 TaxID=2603222 RepID=UPI0037C73222